jgi:hypothetical protein
MIFMTIIVNENISRLNFNVLKILSMTIITVFVSPRSLAYNCEFCKF